MTETPSKEYVLGVGGMTCNNCVNHVETALSNIDGVLEVEVNLAGAKATINTNGTPNQETLESAVTNAGYSIHEPGADLGLLQLDSVPKDDFNWNDGAVWKQSALNTKWCLIGCSIGDFGNIFFFQYKYRNKEKQN